MAFIKVKVLGSLIKIMWNKLRGLNQKNCTKQIVQMHSWENLNKFSLEILTKYHL